jgi:hypothetical protein
MRKRQRLMVAGALVLGLVLGATALAVAGNAGVIYACVNDSGTVKIVADGTVCNKNWTPVHWNQEGAPGQDGTNGTDGADGAAGISGYQQVSHTETFTDVADNDLLTATVTCPGGKKVLGGGASGFITAQTHLVASNPRATDESRWDVVFQATSAASDVSISAYAICGFVAP